MTTPGGAAPHDWLNAQLERHGSVTVKPMTDPHVTRVNDQILTAPGAPPENGLAGYARCVDTAGTELCKALRALQAEPAAVPVHLQSGLKKVFTQVARLAADFRSAKRAGPDANCEHCGHTLRVV